MKYLFVLQYPGYLRYFDTVIKGLVANGHTVATGYDIAHKQPEGVEALAGTPIVDLGTVPKRSSEWNSLARGLRGTIDYVRYLDPRFHDAIYLRDRMRKALPPLMAPLGRLNTLSTATTNRMLDVLHVCERAVPPSETLTRFLKHERPDVVVVSPLVTDQCPQVDMVKAAQALGIPTALGVASWDHLTTKGLMRIEPDLVLVWNPHQKAEALAYHRVHEDRIVVTGAQPFDRWFGRAPSRSREEFCRTVGLPADRPIDIAGGDTEVGTLRTATEESVIFQVDEDFTIPPARPAARGAVSGSSFMRRSGMAHAASHSYSAQKSEYLPAAHCRAACLCRWK